MENENPVAIAEQLGARLKQARLNADLTQTEVARQAGVSRKTLINAEKGKVQLDAFVAILLVLKLTDSLDNFLPVPAISPLQLVKLQGKKRQRASGLRKIEEPEPGASIW